MRHQRNSRRFGRTTAHRLAMFRNMVTSLFVHDRILTTLEKAKELRGVAERLITLGKRGDLSARRLAASRLNTTGQKINNRKVQVEEALRKLFDEIAPRFSDRPGGYTRIIRTGSRHGDNAQMAFLELLPEEKKPSQKRRGATKKKSEVAKPAAKKAKAEKSASEGKAAAPKKTAATKKKAKPKDKDA